MTDSIVVQYMGFEVQPSARLYKFLVRGAQAVPREFTLAIPNEAFNSRRARFQDAPDICSLKLHHELANSANQPLTTQFRITDAELEIYSTAHWKKPRHNPFSHKPRLDS